MMQAVVKILFLLLATLVLACGVVEKLANRDPVIQDVTASRNIVLIGDTVTVVVNATDPDDDELTYDWNSNGGSFNTRSASQVVWTAPEYEGVYFVEATVKDKNEGEAKKSTDIEVLTESEPFVAITSPASGEYLVATGPLQIVVEATPVTYITKVEFYVDDQLIGTDNMPPFTVNWNMQGYSGKVEIKTIAYRSVPRETLATDSLFVSLQGVVPIP